MVRILALACALTLSIAPRTVQAGPALPRSIMGEVRAAADATPADGAAIRYWSNDATWGTSEPPRSPWRPEQHVVGWAGPGLYYGAAALNYPTGQLAVVAEIELPDTFPPRLSHGYLGVTMRSDIGERPLILPACTLQRLPEPFVFRAGDEVTVSWLPMQEEIPGTVEGYRVYRSLDGVTGWRLRGETNTSSWSETDPAGCGGYYALTVVLAFGIESTVMSLAAGVPEAPVADRDDDEAADACDNCPDVPNPEQLDTDSDGIGNFCDPSQPPWLLLVSRKQGPSGERYVVSVLPSDAARGTYGLASGERSLPACPFLACYAATSSTCGDACSLERCDIEYWPEPGLRYWLLGTPGPASWDWGTRSDGTPHPSPSPDCP